MSQTVLGIVCVFTLFIICMFLSAVINIAKIKYFKPKPKPRQNNLEPQIIYIDGNALKNATKHPTKKRVVPFEATLINRREFDALTESKTNNQKYK